MTQIKTNSIAAKGFTLIEMAIVLTIMGVVTYGILTISSAQQENARIKETKAKIERINDALTVYFKTYGYLPCPSNGNATIDSVNFGRDLATHTGTNDVNTTDTDCQAANTGIQKSNGAYPLLYRGVVPTRTLGLPDDYMFDAWDYRISYAVSRYCVAPDNWQSFSDTYINKYKCSDDGLQVTTPPYNVTSGGKIHFTGSYGGWGQFMAAPKRPDPYAAYVVISFGPDGSTVATSPGASTWDRAGNGPSAVDDADIEYYSGSYNDGDDEWAIFNDIMTFKTAPQIYYDATKY